MQIVTNNNNNNPIDKSVETTTIIATSTTTTTTSTSTSTIENIETVRSQPPVAEIEETEGRSKRRRTSKVDYVALNKEIFSSNSNHE